LIFDKINMEGKSEDKPMEGSNEEKPMEGVEASQPEVTPGKFKLFGKILYLSLYFRITSCVR
jgi:hypothetical protein